MKELFSLEIIQGMDTSSGKITLKEEPTQKK